MTTEQKNAVPVLELTHTFRAPRDRVFAAWTESDQITQWFGPPGYKVSRADVDLRVGGDYRFVIEPPDAERVEIFGTFREVDPPSRLAYTWSFEPHREHPVRDSVVSIDFKDRGEWTDIVLRHSELPTEAEVASHGQGWKGCFAGLDALLGK